MVRDLVQCRVQSSDHQKWLKLGIRLKVKMVKGWYLIKLMLSLLSGQSC